MAASVSAQRVLVARNDKLGDFMLAYPSFALLKTALPDAHVSALATGYTREMAELCPWIDEVLVDPGPVEGLRGVRGLAAALRAARPDALVALFSTTRLGLAAVLARVPYRLAPATKLAQVFFDRRVVQRRSRSQKPESEYDLDLVRRFLADQGAALPPDPEPPFLRFDPDETARLEAQLRAAHDLPRSARLVFVHPGSGGSAPNLSLAQYAELARSLRSSAGHAIVITAGPGELEPARALTAMLGELPCAVHESAQGLGRFARLLQVADLFVSGSTGVLHVAGALDRPTAAFYPRRRSANPLRWRTLNSPSRRLAYCPPEGADEGDMGAIDLAAAAREISERFLLG